MPKNIALKLSIVLIYLRSLKKPIQSCIMRIFNIKFLSSIFFHQSKKTPAEEYYKVNRDLSLQVAENAKNAGVKQFIFLSTFKVYGKLIHPVKINEKSPCLPNDAYGQSKYEAEIGLAKLEAVNFKVAIIRTPLVYGIGVKANMLSLLRLVNKMPVLPFGKLNNNRCYTFVENLVAFIDRIIEIEANGVFIAMDEKPLSTTELVNYISKYLDKRTIFFKIPDVFVRIVSFFFRCNQQPLWIF
ncbi:MAG: NAD-dependent epimerase/dehydratase family protein [Bacteroidetes bacterium]|nr:NAD-dependent epimerase/dehydratase family protein [Bacteroidota bacterium]